MPKYYCKFCDFRTIREYNMINHKMHCFKKNNDNKIQINKIISIGTLCFSSQLIKNNFYKTESYPFDWIVSNIDMCIDCIKNNFEIFLDKKYHYDEKYDNNRKVGHNIYDKYVNTNIFRHYNIIKSYNYFLRSVNRFLNLYSSNNNILFIHFTQFNKKNPTNEYLNKIKDLKNILIIKFINSNLYILYIHSFEKSSKQKYELIVNENIYILKLWTTSISNGRSFEDNSDNIYINNIFNNLFNYQIKK